ncbi:MAG TPA: DMT family transporter [Gaiellaceae bacterium]|nr:DMT family transporter [Gaiellaceae bacterium]
MEAGSVRAARLRYRETAIRWGFIWALWCAILWGAWYIPGTALFYETPFAEAGATTNGLLKVAAVITTLNAIFVLAAMLVWVAALGKLRDYTRTIRHRSASRWFFAGAVFGGPIAIYGTYLAIAYVGTAFGAVSALLYPLIGAALARVWYHERITRRAALGILIVVAGGVFIFTPGLIDEIRGTGSGDNAWLGYLGGVMAFVGWGIEGAIAGRALDVTDPDNGLTIRFTAENLYWLVLIVPIASIWLGDELWVMMWDAITNPINLVWLVLAGLTFGFCYVSWYKAFPLIGVGRGQAIADLYGMFALIWLTIFTLSAPEWQFWVGGAIAIVGGFVMYTERRDVLEVIRAIPPHHAEAPAAAPSAAGGKGGRR